MRKTEAAHILNVGTRLSAGNMETRCFSRGQLAGRFCSCGFILVGLGVLAGCNSGSYPESLNYTRRSDPLVTGYAKEQPIRFDNPGEFPHMLEDRNNPLLKEAGLVLFPQHDPRPDQSSIGSGDLDKLNTALEEVLGTPANPTVAPISDKTRTKLKLGSGLVRQYNEALDEKHLKLGDERLQSGSALYRLHCVHCHGLTGDGRGPTAPWVNPHPRDYRQGVFKFTSSSQEQGQTKPLRSDLLRTLREGIEGTSMPSFRFLEPYELTNLISYVIHLSLRGQTEYAMMQDLLTPGQEVGDIGKAVRTRLIGFTMQWSQAKTSGIKSGPYPYKDGGEDIHPANDENGLLTESVKNGQKMFKDANTGNCVSCHFDYGRQAPYKYDIWGTIVRPMDLTKGTYRGGRRPIDLYWRIDHGIDGSGMARLVEIAGESEADRAKRIWDLVNFLQVLPYRAMREKYGIVMDTDGR
jgi:mono/diheme cytochrome c family protein